MFCSLWVLSGRGFLYLFSSTAGENFSGAVWTRPESIEYCRMLLGVVLLLLSCSRTIVFVSSQVSDLSSLFLDHLAAWCITLSHGVGLNSDQTLVGCFHNLCHYCTTVSCREVNFIDQRGCRWVGVFLSPLLACRGPSSTMITCS